MAVTGRCWMSICPMGDGLQMMCPMAVPCMRDGSRLCPVCVMTHGCAHMRDGSRLCPVCVMTHGCALYA
eukprot:3762800-Rhodomonas_salina.2